LAVALGQEDHTAVQAVVQIMVVIYPALSLQPKDPQLIKPQ